MHISDQTPRTNLGSNMAIRLGEVRGTLHRMDVPAGRNTTGIRK